jgi:hypothetical protein
LIYNSFCRNGRSEDYAAGLVYMAGLVRGLPAVPGLKKVTADASGFIALTPEGMAGTRREIEITCAHPHGLRSRLMSPVILVEHLNFASWHAVLEHSPSAAPASWRLISFFQFIPRVIRDAIYDLVARNRYRWFCRRDACILPNSDRSWPS